MERLGQGACRMDDIDGGQGTLRKAPDDPYSDQALVEAWNRLVGEEDAERSDA